MGGYKLWGFKELMSSSDVNDLLMSQTISRFPDVGTRNSAITSPQNNQYAYVTGVGLTRWAGSSWVIEIAANPTALVPTPINFTTFYSTWGVYSTAFTAPRYYKTQMGVVHLEGMMKAGTSSDSGEYAVVVPAGYRPLKSHIFPTMSRAGGAFSPNTYITVEANGQISPVGATWRVATADWMSLGGISYLAEA